MFFDSAQAEAEMRGNIALRCAVDAVAAEDAGGRLAQFVKQRRDAGKLALRDRRALG